METWLEGLEPAVEHQELKVPYRYSMGPTASKFFAEIRDNKMIMGIRCPQCNLVYVPPRSTCGRCFSLLEEWKEIGSRGTLQAYTRVRYQTPVQPVPAPFVYGIIKLEGADTGLPHLVGGLEGKEPRIGMALQAVFKENRAGNMLDIVYFQPVEEAKQRKVRAAKGKGKGTAKKSKGGLKKKVSKTKAGKKKAKAKKAAPAKTRKTAPRKRRS